MNIGWDNGIQSKKTLIEYLIGGKNHNKHISRYSLINTRRDTVTISEEAKELSASGIKSNNHRNTSIDRTIDLQSYIDAVKKDNEYALENAGASIDRSAVKMKTFKDAIYSALTDKYTRLVQEARKHSDPESYIEQKYFTPSSPYYESDLSDAERRAGLSNELDMLREGKLGHINFGDSLLRGMSFDSGQTEGFQLQRRLINQQISNIFQQAGIETDSITETYRFTVDPYTYRISVNGVDDSMKTLMENALNVGENGKRLYIHICNATQQENCNNSQINATGQLKYRTAAAVYEYTGLNLNDLIQRDGTFFTETGKDIRDVIKKGIDRNVKKVNQSMAGEYLGHLLSEVGKIDWKNTPDMNLSIEFGAKGLQDIGQSVIFDGYGDREKAAWYSVL